MNPVIPISVGLIVDQLDSNGYYLWLQKRSEDGPLDSLWEAPGGKWNAGESAEEACLREIMEETGVRFKRAMLFKIYSYEYKDRNIGLNAFLMPAQEMPESSIQKWFKINYSCPLEGLENNIPEANKEMIIDLSHYLEEIYKKGQWDRLWQQ